MNLDNVYIWLSYFFLYIAVGLLLWMVVPQIMGKLMPRDPKTFEYRPRPSTYLIITILWPLAIFHKP